MRILNERRAAAEGSYVLMKKTNKCMKMGLLAAALLAGVMMGCSNVSNSGSGDSSGSGDGGQGGGDVQINDKYDTVWTLNAEFWASGLGEYTFVADETRKWEKSEKITEHTPPFDSSVKTDVDATDEYWATGSGTSHGEFNDIPIALPLVNMKVYQYRGDNPLLSAEEEQSYYDADIVQNFRFYRFNCTSPYSLDNFIIAVDAATDFVYAYAEISDSFFNEYGNADIPTAFAAIEKSSKNEKHTPFYEFDPIGYVNEDGTVTLYKMYEEDITNLGVNYFPSVHTTGLDKAEKKADGFGRSPYYTK